MTFSWGWKLRVPWGIQNTVTEIKVTVKPTEQNWVTEKGYEITKEVEKVRLRRER